MPALMDAMSWETKPTFKYSPVYVVTADIVAPFADVYQTIYYPAPNNPIYRASITGNRIIIEYIHDPCFPDIPSLHHSVEKTLEDFGINNCVLAGFTENKQPFGKIVPIDSSVRKNFIHTMSQDMQIYSLGRFATWRQILLDDLVGDIKFIEEFIVQKDSYSATKSMLSRH
jgi:hypothetical protein